MRVSVVRLQQGVAAGGVACRRSGVGGVGGGVDVGGVGGGHGQARARGFGQTAPRA